MDFQGISIAVECLVVILVSLHPPATSNDEFSDAFIESLNANQSSWTAQRNFPADFATSKMRKFGAVFLTGARSVRLVRHKDRPIPESFDAREKWPHCKSIGKIRNQGNCGGCWAFQAASAISDRICIETGGRVQVELSPEDILTCCKNCKASWNGCEGGDPARAWSFWVNDGVVTGGDLDSKEGCKPYSRKSFVDAISPQCTNSCVNNINYAEDKRIGMGVYRISPEVKQMQIEVMLNGPLGTTMAVHSDFYNYKTGVYRKLVTTPREVIHAVKIIGWGEENGTPYWLVANSWGASWGNSKGFFKIVRGENHCSIENLLIAGSNSVRAYSSCSSCSVSILLFVITVLPLLHL